jgi:SsrA-binding protein
MAEDGTNRGGTKSLAVNKKARFNYEIDERMECGIALQGTEVKSMKMGRFSFSDAYARIENDELWLVGFHISPYAQGNLFNHDPDRNRKLLAHKQEIERLRRKIDERGYTLVPTKFYLKHGIVKIELGLGKGKKLFDKRNTIKQRDEKRETDRELRQR